MTVSLDTRQRIKAPCVPLIWVKGKIICKRNSVQDLAHKQTEVEESIIQIFQQTIFLIWMPYRGLFSEPTAIWGNFAKESRIKTRSHNPQPYILSNHTLVVRGLKPSTGDQWHLCMPTNVISLFPTAELLTCLQLHQKLGQHPASILCSPMPQPTPAAKVWPNPLSKEDQCSLFYHKLHSIWSWWSFLLLRLLLPLIQRDVVGTSYPGRSWAGCVLLSRLQAGKPMLPHGATQGRKEGAVLFEKKVTSSLNTLVFSPSSLYLVPHNLIKKASDSSIFPV